MEEDTPNYTYILLYYNKAIQSDSIRVINTNIRIITEYTNIFPDVTDLSSSLIYYLVERKEQLRMMEIK